MNLDAEQLKSKKIIGKDKGRNVIELLTKGGYHLIVVANGASFEPVGAGSHRAIARYIAKQKLPQMEMTELSKAEEVDPATFKQFLPFWTDFTNKLIESSK